MTTYVDELRTAVDAALARALPRPDEAPPAVIEAMQYSLLAGGKRLRPVLALAAADAVADARGLARADARARALPVAAALELIHTYSLVHDDLPAMDDDTLRRGRPTSHVVFGEGMAILAGDGLLTEAFALLLEPHSRLTPGAAEIPAEQRAASALVIARAAGAVGMVGGQAMDLRSEVSERSEAALREMHLRKTGALIQAACVSGAIAAGATPPMVAALETYGREIGLAFQIVDDLLDVEGTDAALGKTAGKDAAAGKLTYPALHGIDGSRMLADACVARAIDAVGAAGLGGGLIELARSVVTRTS